MKINTYPVRLLTFILFFSFYMNNSLAQPINGFGQMIQISTSLHSFVGKPSWLLIIRDVDNDQVIPYLFDIRRGQNSWMAFTYSRHYLITASTLSFSPYKHDPYRTKTIHNFCHLESNGRIQRGTSYVVRISGNLSPSTNAYKCTVTSYPN